MYIPIYVFILSSSTKRVPRTPAQQKSSLRPLLPLLLPIPNLSHLLLQAISPSPRLPSPVAPVTPVLPLSLFTASPIADPPSIACRLLLQLSSSAQILLLTRNDSHRLLQTATRQHSIIIQIPLLMQIPLLHAPQGASVQTSLQTTPSLSLGNLLENSAAAALSSKKGSK